MNAIVQSISYPSQEAVLDKHEHNVLVLMDGRAGASFHSPRCQSASFGSPADAPKNEFKRGKKIFEGRNNKIELENTEPDSTLLKEEEKEAEEILDDANKSVLMGLPPEFVDADDSVALYLKSIGQFDVPTKEEEVALFARLERGDKTAEQEIINRNLRLPVSVAKKYVSSGLPFLDLIQEGNLGLMKAVTKFDYHKGYKFSTYAIWWIRQSITRSIAENGRTIRVPVHMVEKVYRIRRAERDLCVTLNRDPTEEEIAKASGLSIDAYRACRPYVFDPTVSIDTPIGEEDDDMCLGDMLADNDSLSIEEHAENTALHEGLEDAMKGLSERERQIIAMRFGLGGNEPMTLEQVGNIMGVTRERIRQLENRSLRHMHYIARRKRLHDYLR